MGTHTTGVTLSVGKNRFRVYLDRPVRPYGPVGPAVDYYEVAWLYSGVGEAAVGRWCCPCRNSGRGKRPCAHVIEVLKATGEFPIGP